MNEFVRCLGCMNEIASVSTCPYCDWVRGTAPESALHLYPGTILQEKYLIGKALGQGGFGITYLAWDMNLNLKLAIKEYLPQELAYRTGGQSEVNIFKESLAVNFNYGLEKFLEEARTLARFNEHPNIVSVRDFFKANDTAYLVMNHVEGVTLKEYLASRDKPLPFDQALDIFMPVLDALKEVHAAGILHRDISPDNLLLDAKGRVVLIDFGAARQAIGEQSRSMSVIMKAGYSPLEQYQSRGNHGPWTDIYAVAATMYHAITGQLPPESMDRIDEDHLVPPLQLGMEIEPYQEQALLNAMAVRAKDRYQIVEEFQQALLGKKPVGEEKSPEAVKAAADKPDKLQSKDEDTKKCPFCSEQIKASAIICKHCKMDLQESQPQAKEKYQRPLPEEAYTSKAGPKSLGRNLTVAAVVIFGLVVTFYAGSWFFAGPDNETIIEEDSPLEDDPTVETEANDKNGVNADDENKTGSDVDLAQRLEEDYSPETIEVINEADYMIDYEHGTVPLSEVEIGTRVVDPSWEWEFRTGSNYTLKAGDETKPVTWIVVAKDHYEGLEPHVTLLAEELIGRHAFDDSTDRGSDYGSNHWGKSGTTNASLGLRPWLNSSGIHGGEGFYQAFSDSFKSAVITTNVPNKEWEEGSAYSTSDHVFISSTTELGDEAHNQTYRIGNVYGYFAGAGDEERMARLGGDAKWYWTRSPGSLDGSLVRSVTSAGGFYIGFASYGVGGGVRPALNLKSGILVSEISP